VAVQRHDLLQEPEHERDRIVELHGNDPLPLGTSFPERSTPKWWAVLPAVRRSAALAAALLVLPVGAALAFGGSPPITVRVYPKVIPNRAGTPQHPQGVTLDVRVKIGIPINYNPPLVNEIDVWYPRGGLYNGWKYPVCSVGKLNAVGPSGCPPDSIMGHGTGVARADTTFTYPKITVVNGGQSRVYFYTVLNNPARVQEPVVGTITKLSGQWSYKLHTVIPKNLQIVAGVPIVLQSLHIVSGRGDWLATTYCPPDQRWRWRAIAIFTNGQTLKTSGAVACTS
jgi:hypothetical protein